MEKKPAKKIPIKSEKLKKEKETATKAKLTRKSSAKKDENDSAAVLPALPDTSNFSDCYVNMEKLFELLGKETKSLLNAEGNYTNRIYIILLYNADGYGNADLRTLWCSKLDRLGYVDIFMKIWDEFWKKDWIDIGAKASWSGQAGETAQRVVDNFQSAFGILLAMFEGQTHFCKKLWDKGLIRKFVSLLLENQNFAAKTFNDPKKTEATKRLELLLYILGTIQNSVSNCRDRAAEFRETKGVEAVYPYLMDLKLKSDDEEQKKKNTLRALSAMIMAKTVKEDVDTDEEQTAAGIEMLHYFVKGILKSAIESPDRSADGFTIEETLESINCMAFMDAVKIELSKDKEKMLIFWNIFKNPQGPKELQRVTTTFWIISFCKTARDGLQIALPDIIGEMKKLENHEDVKVKNAVQGVLWNFGMKKPTTADPAKQIASGKSGKTTKETAAPAGKMNQIMISYDWSHQETAKRLNQALKERGFRTWMDIEQMSGSTLEAMANAVEQSAAVVMCFSEQYQRSPNCQKDHRYSPSGWLGILLAKKLYIECSSPDDVPDAIDKVVNELNRLLNIVATELVHSKTTPEPLPNASQKKTDSARSTSEVRRWSSSSTISRDGGSAAKEKVVKDRLKKLAEIKTWNEEKVWKSMHTLGFKNANKLEKVNGRMLFQMIRLYKEAPQLFVVTLDKAGLHTSTDILQLTLAFDELIHLK